MILQHRLSVKQTLIDVYISPHWHTLLRHYQFKEVTIHHYEDVQIFCFLIEVGMIYKVIANRFHGTSSWTSFIIVISRGPFNHIYIGNTLASLHLSLVSNFKSSLSSRTYLSISSILSEINYLFKCLLWMRKYNKRLMPPILKRAIFYQ